MFCAQCGTRLPDNARFCESCGKPVSPPAAADEAPQPVVAPRPVVTVPSPPQPMSSASRAGLASSRSGTSSRGGWRIAAIVVAVLAALAAGGRWLAGSGSGPLAEAWATAADAVRLRYKQLALGDAERKAAFESFARALDTMDALERGVQDDAEREAHLLEALTDAERATLIDPTAAPYWHLLGYVYSQFKGDIQASVMGEDAFAVALRLNPESLSTHLMLARTLLERAAYSRALDHLEWAGRKRPQVLGSALASDMCRAYLADEQAARGIAYFREVLAQKPDAGSAKLALAILLHDQARDGEAGRLLEELRGGAASAEDQAYAGVLGRAWRGGAS